MSTAETRSILAEIAAEYGTPAYAYSLPQIEERTRSVYRSFGERLSISYAAKSNPNPVLLRELHGLVDYLDVSSGGEIQLGLAAGWSPDQISFTGPAKTDEELRVAIEVGIAHVIVESVEEARRLARLAAERNAEPHVLMRVAPRDVPKGFGARMSGRATQFGIAEEDAAEALAVILSEPRLTVDGFHSYSGTQCLEADSIVENYRNMARIFMDLSGRLGRPPAHLVFGSGLGVPYHAGQEPLDLGEVARDTAGVLDDIEAALGAGTTKLVLETGRYLVGEAGYYLTRVIEIKESRGKKIAICDGGMNHHLAASGNLGAVIHRNYPFFSVTADAESPERDVYQVVGPLCTSIDTLGQGVELPVLKAGDVIAISSSGAYGLTTSPIHFISHSAPREVLVRGTGSARTLRDISSLVAGPAAWAGLMDEGSGQ